ncbi:MAG: hypothetical protein AAGM46_03775 [Cyanobacteria bacterium J06582_2]
MKTKCMVEKSVIKTSIANPIKVEFKIICVKNELTISNMIENLIETLLSTDRYIPRDLEYEDNNMQVVKAYLPKELKLRFRIFCTQRQIPMNYVLRYLIETRVQGDS